MTSYAQRVWFVPKIAILSEKKFYISFFGDLRHTVFILLQNCTSYCEHMGMIY